MWTLILGNFVAITQTDLKRMLAYSSIAHGGYILIAIAAGGTPGVGDSSAQAALVYLMSYTFTNIGAFAVVIALERSERNTISLNDTKGLAQHSPLLAAAMTIFMLSLTGVPLTAGFIGKFFVFKAALEANLEVLAVIGVLVSVVSAYYYLRIIVNMYMVEGDAHPVADKQPLALRSALWVTAMGTLILGILPYIMTDLAQDVTLAIVGR